MEEQVLRTIAFVKETLANAEAGHDWLHTERVWKLFKIIAHTEECNQKVVELSALLHDIADAKFHQGDENLALEIASQFLEEIKVEPKEIEPILWVMKHISFKNRGDLDRKYYTKELEIVQDADRLDAIGAIGIARAFHFGGYRNNLIYHPDIKPRPNQSKEEYKKSNGTTINHFHEKLLLIKDFMNTEKGKEIAEERHRFMLSFLEQFDKEMTTLMR